jgi:hypothetical protein
MKQYSRDTIEAFASLFRGRTDAHGQVNECVYEPVTLEHYEKHLKGETNLGIYLVLDDSTCHFAAIDLDEKDFNKAKAIRDELINNSIPAYITQSKSKGFHIYCFALERFKAVEIRRVLQHVLSRLNIKAEVFPKQDYHQPDDADGARHPGSYINLPCFGYTRPFLSGDLKEVPLEVALERIKFVPQEVVDRVLKIMPADERIEEGLEPNATPKGAAKLPCFAKMLAGVKEGFRHIASFRLAVMLYRQGMDQQLARATLLKWDKERNQPPLGEKHINRNITDAYTGKYSLGCPDIEVGGYCFGSCAIYQKRWHEHDRRTEARPADAITIKSIKVVGTGPPSYECTLDRGKITLTTAELMQQSIYKKKIMETFGVIPNIGMKQVEWELYLNDLLAKSDYQKVRAEDKATEEARLMEQVYSFFDMTKLAEEGNVEEAKTHVFQKDERFYFDAKMLEAFLGAKFRLTMPRADLYRLIMRNGGQAGTVRWGKKTFHRWSLPVPHEEENMGEEGGRE